MSKYYANCDQVIPDHQCDPCDVGELGRVRAVAFIKDDFEILEPSTDTEWLAGIESGDIVIIPETNGDCDGGKPKEGAGFGDRISTVIGYEYGLKYKDPNYAANYLFYNAVKNFSGYKFAYKTETQIHMTDVTVTVLPKNPVENSLDSQVTWDVEVKWVSKNLAEPFDEPDQIFVCIQGEDDVEEEVEE